MEVHEPNLPTAVEAVESQFEVTYGEEMTECMASDLESLKQEVKAPASAVPEAAPAGAVGEEKEGEVEEDEPKKKKARSSAEEIVIDDDDNEEEDSKDIGIGDDNNAVVSNNEVILID